MIYQSLKLKQGKIQSIIRRHPWIFSGALIPPQKGPANGDKVHVIGQDGKILATGHYSDGSIAVRILSFERTEINQSYYEERLGSALNVRNLAGLISSESTNAFRLVHGEGDQLPGLVIDIYKGVAVIQAHSQGMADDIELISSALQKVLGPKLTTVVAKSAERDSIPSVIFGKELETVDILEYGNQFRVNVITGQKTGFFLDQRENRNLIARYAPNKRILNAFSYSGGFSIYALKAGASEVHSLDSSEKAMALVEENLQLNGFKKNHISLTENALEYLNAEKALEANYDLIVLDPPAFAKHRSARHKAVQAYKRLNQRALEILKPGGILFTFSCSQVVTPDLFNSTIAAAAIEANRHVRILHHLHQPEDHPVSIFHPEGEYLKGLVLIVE